MGGHHHADLGRAEQQLEIVIAVLAHIGDALALLEAGGEEGVGDLVGAAVEGLEGAFTPLEGEGDRLRPLAGPIAGDLGQGRHLVEVDHRRR
jgi:hypothetical protein